MKIKLNLINKSNRARNASNILNEVFMNGDILDSEFHEVQNKSKCILSSTSSTEKSEIKKNRNPSSSVQINPTLSLHVTIKGPLK